MIRVFARTELTEQKPAVQGSVSLDRSNRRRRIHICTRPAFVIIRRVRLQQPVFRSKDPFQIRYPNLRPVRRSTRVAGFVSIA